MNTIRLVNVPGLFSKLFSGCWFHFLVIYDACFLEYSKYIACSAQGLFHLFSINLNILLFCLFKNKQNQNKKPQTFYIKLHGE